jgi:dTDP-4-dehydrorhamnose 3,5-epimerase-like enzyme
MSSRTKTTATVVRQPQRLADDERGVIEKLVGGDFQSVLRITSKKGTVRANHYHQHDSHICFLASGKIRYVERPVYPAASTKAAKNKPAEVPLGSLSEYVIEPGQLFYTAPMIAHAMEFLADSEFYCFTPRSGQQDEYEDDVVRVILIDPDAAAARAT